MRLLGVLFATPLLGFGAPNPEYLTNLPFKVVETIPRTFFATSPPIEKCDTSLLENLGMSLGLEEGEMTAIINQLLAAVGGLVDGMSRDASTREYRALMKVIRDKMDREIKEGKRQSKWEPSGLFMNTWPLQRKVMQIENFMENLLGDPAVQKKLLKVLVDVAPSQEVKSILEGALKDEQQASCTSSDQIFCENRDSISNRGFTIPEIDLDLNSIPDLVTGFLTSRMMSRILYRALGQLTWSNTGFTVTISLPSPMTNLGEGICEAADVSYVLDFDHEWAICGMVTLLTAVLSCEEGAVVDCSNAALAATPNWEICDLQQGSVDWTKPIDLALQPLSEAVVDGVVTEDAIKKEGFVYYYLWMATLAQNSWTQTQSFCEVAPNPLQLVPGWDRVFEVWSNQEADPKLVANDLPSMPLVTLSRKGTTVLAWDDGSSADEASRLQPRAEGGTSCEFLITQRGTSGAYEWFVNFQAQQSPLAGSEGTLVHRGYSLLAASVVNLLDDWLQRNVFDTNQCQISETKITITGHSLGGGLAEVYGLHFAEKWATQGATIEIVSFAPAHGLDQAATDRLASLANVRSIVSELDIIPYFPCQNTDGLPRCDSRTGMGILGDGQDVTYAAHLNPVTISVSELATWNEAFAGDDILTAVAGLSGIQSFSAQVPNPLQVTAWHVCSYSCWVSSRFCTSEAANRFMCTDCPAYATA